VGGEEGGGVMAKDRLVVIHDNWVYRIAWWIAEYGEQGLVLGDGGGRPAGNDDTVVAERALKGSDRDRQGFFWDSKSAAKRAIRVANAAIKNADRPLPDWAKQAIEAGWKAPKGWRP
jgi:hypothetical protein